MCEVSMKIRCRNSDVRDWCGLKEDVVNGVEKSTGRGTDRLSAERKTDPATDRRVQEIDRTTELAFAKWAFARTAFLVEFPASRGLLSNNNATAPRSTGLHY
ncbi:hypothetical protein EVAR_23841_1 [Eumeta japonica]|uniref:Uncharacterized protein n=1 Tax=Eumeta variegata TaxID=151549 RepID=A0A4C1V4C6_EUMVA|nr:hypothetical protein EVAR_23841_1 [Eumeta japonica]